MKRAIALAGLTLALVAPAAAQAGQVTFAGGILRYTDQTGGDDDIQIRRDATDPKVITIMRDAGAPITESAAECDPPNFDVITCTLANADDLTRVVVDAAAGRDQIDFSDLGVTGEANLGPGDDVGNVIDQARPFNVVLRGGDGSDNLIGSHLNDVLDGGGDSDFIQGLMGADDIVGGSGFDFLDYRFEANRPGRVVVTLDDVRDDGNPELSELDNVHSDVEDVTGTENDDVLVGSAGNNVLYGHEGNDRLVGGAGFDVLFGAVGDDVIEARDGLAERVDCAQGAGDQATIDDIDSPNACESIDSSPEAIPDRDGDGITKPADCNDTDDRIRPGAFDIPDDNVDQDCNGADAVDLDRDNDNFARPQDCDDNRPAVFPGADDVPGNGVDEDCDGADDPLPEIRAGLTFATRPVGGRTRFTSLVLTNLAKGDRASLRCRTKRCPLRRRTVTARRNGTLDVTRRVGRPLRRGTVLEWRIERNGAVPLILRLTIARAGKPPASAKLCQPPGAAKPRRCTSA